MTSYVSVNVNNGLNVQGSAIITAANNKFQIDGIGSTITGALTCSGNAVFSGTSSGTGIKNLISSYYTETIIDSIYYTKQI